MKRAWAVALLLTGCGPTAAATIEETIPPVVHVTEVRAQEPKVILVNDRGPGLHGALGQVALWQEARQTGPTGDRLDFVFTGSAEVHGVLVSVDVPDELAIVEVAAGINVETYGVSGDDWLIHTSDAGLGPSKIDEAITFPEPFLLEAGDRVSVVAWLQNNGTARAFVSPEVIVYFR